MKLTACFLAFLAFFVSATDGFAGLITIDPDDFAAGSNVSNAWDGVSLSVEGLEIDSGNVSTSVFSVTGSASTGTQVFGNFFDEIVFTQGWAQVARALRVDFERPVNSVAIDIIGRNNSIGEMLAYNAGGFLIGSYRTNPLLDLSLFETAFIDVKVPISYVLVGAVPGATSFPTVRLDNLVYKPLPEPGTLALFAIGLAGMGLVRRRANSQP